MFIRALTVTYPGWLIVQHLAVLRSVELCAFIRFHHLYTNLFHFIFFLLCTVIISL